MAENPDAAAYRFLYERAVESLRRQEAAVDELRARTGTLLAAAALVASLLGDAALADGLGTSGIVGLACFAVASCLSIGVLLPVSGWIFEPGLGDLFTDFVERDPPLSMKEIHRELAIHHANHIDKNEKRLTPLYWAFRGSAALLVLEVALLLFDITPGGSIAQ